VELNRCCILTVRTGFDCLNQQDPRWNDVNVISSLIKSFFRKLPDPLITAELYSSLIEASKMEPDALRLNAIKRLIDELPEPHYSTLRFLICHLSKVAKKSSINKMEARNLAIVFGPTLIRPGDDNTVTMVTDMSHQCRIVETLIDKADNFFPEDLLDAQPPNSPTQVHKLTILSFCLDFIHSEYFHPIGIILFECYLPLRHYLYIISCMLFSF